ncbi:unnamed protein product [Rangifer tarandus platyrhynchus]|uniref:Uncharacterized protein n=2 Tax=Rangifer tarandus platyrhynchus TaxID=3082113 RepID=A0ACB0E962_RANTA|nr:unnamed protein product [Rangifer tarandus platyrhynchus]CAI9696873.1 unnamed protein product [Rangifer tarandus platyrhynchus]
MPRTSAGTSAGHHPGSQVSVKVVTANATATSTGRFSVVSGLQVHQRGTLKDQFGPCFSHDVENLVAFDICSEFLFPALHGLGGGQRKTNPSLAAPPCPFPDKGSHHGDGSQASWGAQQLASRCDNDVLHSAYLLVVCDGRLCCRAPASMGDGTRERSCCGALVDARASPMFLSTQATCIHFLSISTDEQDEI